MATHSAQPIDYEARRSQMLAQWLTGRTFVEIGAEYGITKQAVHLVLKPVITPEIRARHDTKLAERQAQKRQADQAQLVARLTELMSEGASRSTILRELAISEFVFGRIKAKVDPALERRWYSVTHQGTFKYSDEEVSAALREAAALNGGKLSRDDYERLRQDHPDWPSGSLFFRRGWNKELAQAGIPTTPRSPWLGSIYSDEQYQVAVRRVGKIYGRLFEFGEYEAERLPGEPGAAMMCRRFGGSHWIDALLALAPELGHK